MLEHLAPGRSSIHRLLQVAALALHYPPARLLHRLRWEGIQHVPRLGPAILAPNHASLLDGTVVALAIFRAHRGRVVRWLAAKDQVEGPFGPYLRFFSTLPVDLGAVDLAAQAEAIRTLMRGQLLGIFPEGGITRDGRLRCFQSGAAWLALRSGVPLVPVTINGSLAAWPRGSRWPRPGRVEIVFHPPVEQADLRERRWEIGAAEELTARLFAKVASRYESP